MFGRQLDWELLEELECPVCTEYMASPIKMCENGHNICGGCKERLTDCPTCRGKITNVRNLSVEKFASTALYPCKNREAGCEETFTVDDRNEHLSVCLYQIRKCPVSVIKDVDCSWTGTLSDIPVHIRAEHDSEIADVPGHFNMKLLDLVRGRRYIQLVLVMGEFFCLYCGTEYQDIDFTVLHLGLKEDSQAFKYGIKIGNSEEYVTGTRKCQSYLDVDLTDWPLRKSVAINVDTIFDFVNESGCLSCEIEIGRNKLDGFVLEEQQENLPVVSVVSFEIVVPD
jgi:hypothetical protein